MNRYDINHYLDYSSFTSNTLRKSLSDYLLSLDINYFYLWKTYCMPKQKYDGLWNTILGILLLFSVHDALLVSNIFGSSSRSLHVGLWSSVDFRQNSKPRPAASSKEFPNKQKRRKAERAIKDGNDFWLRRITLRKAMEERTIIGELMLFQTSYTKYRNFYSVFARHY